MGKGASQMRLVGKASGGGHFGGGHPESEKGFRPPQADRHQHLMRRDVKMRFELALKMPGLSAATAASSSKVTGRM